MKRLIFDLDGTLTVDDPDVPYRDKEPNVAVVERLREYRERGFEIVISSSRQMRTYSGNVGMINVHTLPVIVDWLRAHDIPFDEIHVGKPWCGFEGFYIDDKAVRPREFASLSSEEIEELLLRDR